jgi:beta-N-acetylhexosaminidase
MPAVGRLGEPTDSIRGYVRDGLIGGVLLLNGTKEQFTSWVKEFNAVNTKKGYLPFLYSADAEPSLVNSKIKGSAIVRKANEHTTEEQVIATTQSISKDLNDIGINYNFSPVVDMSSNKTVGYRGFGSKPENIVPFSKTFIETTQAANIIATAKHFPGHGLVSGDTHSALQVIDGQMKEIGTYPPLIEAGLLSIMIAHIGVKNNALFNTNGLPSTCSKSIVTDLLRDSLGFKGLVVTDAMNMGGISRVKDADLKCIQAGCDILLMPLNVRRAHRNLLKTYMIDPNFQALVDQAVKRILRAKICLGLIN